MCTSHQKFTRTSPPRHLHQADSPDSAIGRARAGRTRRSSRMERWLAGRVGISDRFSRYYEGHRHVYKREHIEDRLERTVTNRGRRVPVITAIAVAIAFTAFIAPAATAGATAMASPSLVNGSYWCGHYN